MHTDMTIIDCLSRHINDNKEDFAEYRYVVFGTPVGRFRVEVEAESVTTIFIKLHTDTLL